MSPVHRRDRAALVLLRMTLGLLMTECGVTLLRAGYRAGDFAERLNQGLAQNPLGLAVIERFHVLADHADLAAQVIIAVHLLGGILLLIGVLTRSASLLIGLIYLALATLDPQPATVLIGVISWGLALSDAGKSLTLHRLAAPTRPSHQSTTTD